MTCNSFSFLLVAAGRGSRAGGQFPKQYQNIGGMPLLARTIRACLACAPNAPLYPVLHPQDVTLYESHVRPALADMHDHHTRLRPPIMGGETRQQSVLLGLEAMAQDTPLTHVLIHDGARPFLTPKLVQDALAVLSSEEFSAAAPILPVTDHLIQIHKGTSVDRADIRRVQTPQAFVFQDILEAHRSFAGRLSMPDDTSIALYAGLSLEFFPGDPQNIKITTREDFKMANAMINQNLSDIRVGQGIDVHAFTTGDHIWLGGVRIPHAQALKGHSDADVLIHALVDALLGGLCEGDIGVHFPPSDPQWKDADSRLFLTFARDRLQARGGKLAHVDATLVCEAPKLGPYREEIRDSLAALLGISLLQISVKATTSEKLGFTGRQEGIAAFATVTIRLPETRDDD